MSGKTYSYLALGDSYTIGESVPLFESFPYQFVQFLRKSGMNFQAPEIIAKTGWTTDELKIAIDKTILLPVYDFVTLLIGVNNQYRGLSIEIYEKEFEELLMNALKIAGNNKNRVFVLSIPDWGITPFAADRDQKKISTEIDAFNKVNETLSKKLQVQYIDITELTREAVDNELLLTNDKLHPSGLEYKRWAEKLLSKSKELFNS